MLEILTDPFKRQLCECVLFYRVSVSVCQSVCQRLSVCVGHCVRCFVYSHHFTSDMWLQTTRVTTLRPSRSAWRRRSELRIRTPTATATTTKQPTNQRTKQPTNQPAAVPWLCWLVIVYTQRKANWERYPPGELSGFCHHTESRDEPPALALVLSVEQISRRMIWGESRGWLCVVRRVTYYLWNRK